MGRGDDHGRALGAIIPSRGSPKPPICLCNHCRGLALSGIDGSEENGCELSNRF